MNFLLIYRFSFVGVGFMVLYEFSKFYIFGDRFLPEAVIVYPFVYLIGLIWYKLNKKTIYLIDYIIAGIFTWFIVFMREPYALAAIVSFVSILWQKKDRKQKIISFIIFLLLTIVTVLTISIPDYIFQVVTVNNKTQFAFQSQSDKLFGSGIFPVFLYPVYLYFGGVWNIFRIYIILLDSVFLYLILLYWSYERKIKPLFIILFILGLANLRVVTPGYLFFGSFHLLPWYATFIFFLFLLLQNISIKNKKIGKVCLFVLIGSFIFFVFAANSYIREKNNPQAEFITNYGNTLQIGEVVKNLSSPKNTLFLDGSEDLIYWEANRLSPYPFSLYTSIMPRFQIYQQARLSMFMHNPPDFYYDYCTKEKLIHSSLPTFVKSTYVQLSSEGKPTCLYIKKSLLPRISELQWQKAKEFHYTLSVRA